jgi:hypothetical protein
MGSCVRRNDGERLSVRNDVVRLFEIRIRKLGKGYVDDSLE